MTQMDPVPPQWLQEALNAAHSAIESQHPERDRLTAREINDGYCREFAREVLNHAPEDAPLTVWSDGHSHTWIESDGAYYDAERPCYGAMELAHLPFYSHPGQPVPPKSDWVCGFPEAVQY